METGKVLALHITGRDAGTRKVFETTEQKIAAENGFDTKKRKFSPSIVVLGKNQLFPLLEQAVSAMKLGEEKIIMLEPKDAFGERKKELIKVVPLKQFLDHKIRPFPGLIIDADGTPARVQSVSGGRVRIDFNSDLAGKKVEYALKVIKEYKTDSEKAEAFVEKYFAFDETPHFSFKNETLEVTLLKNLPKEIEFVKKAFEKELKENLPNIKEVKYAEKDVAKDKSKNAVKENMQNKTPVSQ
jgi:FKBP-type peptidyl-prolyl cis-trans isomerase 2